MVDKQKHIMNEAYADKAWAWCKGRGGVAVWKSINLSNPGASWSSPALEEDGKPYHKPTWQAEMEPSAIYQAEDIVIGIAKEVKRFHIAVRMGAQGLVLKVSDASTRKIRAAVARAAEKSGKTSWYTFDYDCQEAVIMVDEKLVPLLEYASAKGWE